MDKTEEAKIQEIVQSAWTKIQREFTASKPSVKLKKSAKGDMTYEVKVYGHDIVKCVNEARMATKFLAKQYGFDPESDDIMPPIEAYENEVVEPPPAATDVDFQDVPANPRPEQAFDGEDEDDPFA